MTATAGARNGNDNSHGHNNHNNHSNGNNHIYNDNNGNNHIYNNNNNGNDHGYPDLTVAALFISRSDDCALPR